ncbi:hypothetical protein [Cytobacillus eiseniae]|nr:hypothetical protein [Cytobacillus eiseniae]
MHYSEQEWMKYVKNELAKDVREEFEHHLYSCDQCLDTYLLAVEAEEALLPKISNEVDFTDLVMTQITKTKVEKHKAEEKKKRFYHSSIFHYSIAAAMTILLMTTGVFQSITQYAENVQSPSFQGKNPSMTEGLVNKTFAWMDTFSMNMKEDK